MNYKLVGLNRRIFFKKTAFSSHAVGYPLLPPPPTGFFFWPILPYYVISEQDHLASCINQMQGHFCTVTFCCALYYILQKITLLGLQTLLFILKVCVLLGCICLLSVYICSGQLVCYSVPTVILKLHVSLEIRGQQFLEV